MTNHWTDIYNSKGLLIFSNPVEAHPGSTQWIVEARNQGAQVVLVDPRRTRSAAIADQHLRIRPGTDIAFVNGVIKKAIAEMDAEGSAAMAYTSATSYTYKSAYLSKVDTSGHAFDPAGTGANVNMTGGWPSYADALFRLNANKTDYRRYGVDTSTAHALDPNAAWLALAGPTGYPTNQDWANAVALPIVCNTLDPSDSATNGQTVYQYMRDRMSAYTSAKVSEICGCTEQEFDAAAETFLSTSWFRGNRVSTPPGGTVPVYQAATILYAMGTTQHTYGSQNCKAYSNLQVVTGNIGKFGGGVNALRGIANVQGSTDQGLLYGNLPGYQPPPTAVSVSSSNFAAGSGTQITVSSAAAISVGDDIKFSDNKRGMGLSAAPLNTSFNVTAKSGTGNNTLTLSPAFTADPTGKFAFLTFESWARSQSFGGRLVWPTGGARNTSLTWTGSIPWGHAGMHAMTSTWFSEGYGSQEGGLATNAFGAANTAVEALYDKYFPKSAGLNHRDMFHQMASTQSGYSASKSILAGMCIFGQNPRVTEANALNVSRGLQNLDFLLVVDRFITETADVDRKTDAPTYFLPAASWLEKAGSMTNSGRWIQWKYQAKAQTAGTRTDMEILLKLARALHIKCAVTLGYADGATAFGAAWNAQVAGAGYPKATDAGLANPATAWSNNDYRASLEGEDEGIGPAGLAYSGYAERVFRQLSTNEWDAYGNMATNWLQGYGGGALAYGAYHQVATTADSAHVPKNRSQSRTATDNTTGNKLYPNFGWAWLRNRRIFYNKGSFAPGDVADIFVTAEECAKLFVNVSGGSGTAADGSPIYLKYARTWRVNRKLGDAALDDTNNRDKRGYTPVHWEPVETPKANLLATYGNVGIASYDNVATTKAERSEFPLTLVTFRHTEHYQGGPMSRNVRMLGELVPNAIVQLNTADAGAAGIKSGDNVDIASARTVASTTVGVAYSGGTTLSVASTSSFATGNSALVGTGVSVRLTAAVLAAAVDLYVTSNVGIAAGDQILVGAGAATEETRTVDSTVGSTQIKLLASTPCVNAHSADEWVMKQESPKTVTVVDATTLTLSSALANPHVIGVKVYNLSNGWIGPWKAVVGAGLQSNQAVGAGVVGVPWHWGSKGLFTGPTANDLCIDALDVNTTMPESRSCLVKIRKTP